MSYYKIFINIASDFVLFEAKVLSISEIEI